MKLTDKMKHYNFWVALSMAFLLLLNTVARAFHLQIDNVLYNDIVMAVLGVVTVLGFVQKDGYEFTDTSKADADKKADDNKKDAAELKETTLPPREHATETAASEIEIVITPDVVSQSAENTIANVAVVNDTNNKNKNS